MDKTTGAFQTSFQTTEGREEDKSYRRLYQPGLGEIQEMLPGKTIGERILCL